MTLPRPDLKELWKLILLFRTAKAQGSAKKAKKEDVDDGTAATPLTPEESGEI